MTSRSRNRSRNRRQSPSTRTGPARVIAWIRWYLREVSGEADYDRHCRRHLQDHPDHPVPSRREYEAWRAAHKENHPQTRCC